MEQPPGSLDDLQPQDLSISSLPTVIDLTRKSEECVLNATSLDAVRMVKSPGWYPNSATSSTGLPFSETGSSNVQPGDQIQPDNAFSHTTVTLSYVSRSHVFTTHDSLSGHSPLYGVQSISKFSLHPPPSDSEKGPGETGYALNQHYLEHVDRPMDLATQTELFQSLSPAQVGPEDNVQKLKEFNGADVEAHLEDDKEHNHDSLQNGQGDSWSSSEVCAESPPETPNADTKENTESENSDVLFLMSTKQDALVVPRNEGSRDICSLNREFISPLEDPVSPSATSLDDVEDVFLLPQASSSPSADNSFLDTADEGDGLRTQEAIEPKSTLGDSTPVLYSCDKNKQRRKAVLEPLIDLTEDTCMSDVLEENLKKTVHVNGNARALQRTLKEKTLPMRSGRGTRLDAIVMNINSSRYKVSGCIRTNKKCSQTTSSSDSITKSPQKNGTQTRGKRKITAKASFSEKKVKQKTRLKRGQTNNFNTDNCKDSTSDSGIINSSRRSSKQLSPQQSKKKPEVTSQQGHSAQTTPVRLKRKSTSGSGLQCGVHENSKKPENSHSEHSLEVHVARISPSKSPKKSQGTAKGKVTKRKASPAAKTKAARTRKRSRKKLKCGQSSFIFSPKEPEIKLKYVNYKEERRETRFDTFSPFIRVESKVSSPSLCTIINYPEEVRTQHKKGQQQQGHSSGFVSAVVPSTSCLQLGRPSTHSQHQRLLVCCLCGQSANAMDLGDLHGPYYPEGYQPSTKTPARTSGLKEDEDDDYSDSDSSSCSIRGGRRKCANPPAPWSLRKGTQLKPKDRLESHQWTDGTGSPAAKRARSGASCADVEDWYSPPLLPLEPCEYWLHEDCGIWSAGVFLVKGKVYGLEEAVKVAQETMCSACHDPGATLGCFFKVCPNKYHYRCALESDCILIEENFSMKCKKHKNKTFKAPPGSRWDDR